MEKITVIRSNPKLTMMKRVERRRGRGAKFQWNAAATSYIISSPLLFTKTYSTFKEADKAWVYLTLLHS